MRMTGLMPSTVMALHSCVVKDVSTTKPDLQGLMTYIVIILVRNLPMFSVNKNPVEAGNCRDSFGECGSRKATAKNQACPPFGPVASREEGTHVNHMPMPGCWAFNAFLR